MVVARGVCVALLYSALGSIAFILTSRSLTFTVRLEHKSYSDKEAGNRKELEIGQGGQFLFTQYLQLKMTSNGCGCKNPCVVPPLEGAKEQAASGTKQRLLLNMSKEIGGGVFVTQFSI